MCFIIDNYDAYEVYWTMLWFYHAAYYMRAYILHGITTNCTYQSPSNCKISRSIQFFLLCFGIVSFGLCIHTMYALKWHYTFHSTSIFYVMFTRFHSHHFHATKANKSSRKWWTCLVFYYNTAAGFHAIKKIGPFFFLSFRFIFTAETRLFVLMPS